MYNLISVILVVSNLYIANCIGAELSLAIKKQKLLFFEYTVISKLLSANVFTIYFLPLYSIIISVLLNIPSTYSNPLALGILI